MGGGSSTEENDDVTAITGYADSPNDEEDAPPQAEERGQKNQKKRPGPGKKKKKRGKGKGFKVPKNWKDKCSKDKKWCEAFLKDVIKHGAQKKLFGGKAPPPLKSNEKKKVVKSCGKKKACIKVKTLEEQVKKLGVKRASNLTKDSGSGMGLWLAIGGILLLLVIGFALYYFVFAKGASKKGKGGKEGSKSSKSKSSKSGRKSKSGKSALKSSLRSKAGKSKAKSKMSRSKRTKKSAIKSKVGKSRSSKKK